MSVEVHMPFYLFLAETRTSVLLTGIPQLVLIPAPVTTMTLRDFPKLSAICCSSRTEPALTCRVGIVAAHNLPLVPSLFCG